MITTIGVDKSKHASVYSVYNIHGQRSQRVKLVNDPQQILAFLDQIPGPKQLALEATRDWGLFYEAVKDHVDFFHLGHPRKMKIITESETKNDSQDADLIAQLTQSGFLPKAHVASLETRQWRSLLRFRHFCVRQRADLRNQVQTLLDRNLWPCQRPTSFKSPFCQRGLVWMNQLSLPQRERFILDQSLEYFRHLSAQILQIERLINEQISDLEGLAYLRTVPGFRTGKVHAAVVLTEIGNIQRFHRAKHLAHYAGLIPSEYSSGDKHRTGRLVKQANHFLRTAIIESTFAAVRADKELKAYYQSVKKRSSSGSAVIACARKLCYVIYHVLKEQRHYYPFPPAAACHSSAILLTQE